MSQFLLAIIRIVGRLNAVGCVAVVKMIDYEKMKLREFRLGSIRKVLSNSNLLAGGNLDKSTPKLAASAPLSS
jgi:hypothetical protein